MNRFLPTYIHVISLFVFVLFLFLPPVVYTQELEYNKSLKLTHEWLNDHQLRLSWKKARTPLVLEKKFANATYFMGLAQLDEGTNEFIDDSLAVNTEYEYRLRPVNVHYLDEYGPSLEVEYVLPAPPPPSVKQVGIDEVAIALPEDSLEWHGNINVEMRREGVFTNIGDLAGHADNLIVGDLRSFRPELFRLSYVSEVNQSDPSSADTTILLFPPPQNLQIAPLSDHSIRLTWSPPTEFEHAYQVEKQVKENTRHFDIAFGDTVFIDDNVDFDTRTFYRVRGTSGENIGEFSRVVPVKLVMNAVADLQVDKVEDLAVELTWEEPAPVTSTYLVQRSLNGRPFETITELPATSRSYIDRLPMRGINAVYRIVSVNALGDEIVSDPVGQKVRTVSHGMLLLGDGSGGQSWFVDADEVSAGEFVRFCRETGRNLPDEPDHITATYWYLENERPAVMVTWQDAIEFCNWRSTSMGLQPAYDDSGRIVNLNGGFRLPDKVMYKRTIDSLNGGIAQAANGANLLGRQDGYRWLAPGLGSVVNPELPAHLIGNAWEWVQDPGSGGGRLALGGAFTTPKGIVENTVPEKNFPPTWYDTAVGFRCVLPSAVVAEQN